MQANGNGGLVSISLDSYLGSALANTVVRAHYGVPAEYPCTAAPVRLLRPARVV